MRKAIIALAGLGLIGVSWLVGPAFAASLNRTSQTLGARNVPVSDCDTDGLSTRFTVATGNVTIVTVSGVASACGGLTMTVVVANGATTANGTGVAPVAGGSVAVTLLTPIAQTDVMQTDVLL